MKTMRVKPWGKNQGNVVTINAEDFDPQRHTPIDGRAPATTGQAPAATGQAPAATGQAPKAPEETPPQPEPVAAEHRQVGEESFPVTPARKATRKKAKKKKKVT